MNKIGSRTLKNISNIDPKLSLILGMVLARGKVDFTITSGLRTLEEQRKLFAQGRSGEGKIITNMDGIIKKSYHQTGKAIDFIPYPFKGWNDTESFIKVGQELKFCADFLGIENSYGGHWKSFKDYPHFQIK